MADMLIVNMGEPLISAQVLGTVTPQEQHPAAAAADEQANLLAELESQKATLAGTIQMLQQITGRLSDCCTQMITEHREAIAKLAVEIARKILTQKVRDRDYEIESIVKEVLSKSPTRHDIVIRLNPEDLADLQKLEEQQINGLLTSVKLVGDSNIGRAECVLETPKGHIESLIDEHLEQIAQALAKAV